MEQIRFVINPIAGTRQKISEIRGAIAKVMAGSGSSYEVLLTEKAGDGALLAAEAASRHHPLVVAVGGDGTVNEVASSLVGTSSCLGIIPSGSGNGLARELHIPRDAEAACRILVEGMTLAIDVGLIADRYFLSTAGIGFEARLSKAFNENTAGCRGFWRYLLLGIREFFHYEPPVVKVIINGREFSFRPFILTFANTRQYGNRAIIAPSARANDGLLNVCMIPVMNPLRTVFHLPKLFTGQIEKAPGSFQATAQRVKVIRNVAGTVQVDGENFEAEAALTVSVLSRALKVRCPSEDCDIFQPPLL
ncbi:MAG: diacylglycerol kinase family lipid kinase [Candidatus Tectomicrobia bacterium]|uniref:Diacylglycerol kinase family lipid kinase n=1 Tax=Tectimicrobiota bacterium TaxID=2528274 RepID=A0A932GQW3_UNCTE|nr:diacylglycerol kinase family lipid kinase [Candidatus Tectomicrobia bacterium]